MVDEGIYYEQEKIWGNSPEKYQVQVLFDIIDILPEDVESILDVGCGDGHITNLLPKNLRVVGVDISEEALKYVKREKVVGSIDKLPFPDNSFDLVMINDVLEHLPEDIYDKGLNELQRVANKYILITVPHKEQIETNEAKCASCDTIYHIHWHQRAFDEGKLRCLIQNNDWKISEVRYSGDTTLPPFDPTIKIQREIGIYQHWDGAVCPNCGSNEKAGKALRDEVSIKVIEATRHKKWFGNPNNLIRNNRSEIMALYKSRNASTTLSKPIRVINEKKSDLYCIDFQNKLQAVHPDFTIGSGWARFRLPENVEFVDGGITKSCLETNGTEVPMRFPVVPSIGDCVVIEATGSKTDDGLALYAIDGITGQVELLFEAHVTDRYQTFKITLESVWSADKFGLALSVYLYGGVKLHRITYCSNTKSRSIVPFLQLNKGHNVLVMEEKELKRSWGLWVKEAGLFPKPTWLNETMNSFEEHNPVSIHELLQASEDSYNFSKRKMNWLSAVVEEIERKRSQTEKLLEEKEKQRVHVEKLLEEKEQQRAHAEIAYQKSTEREQYWHNIVTRKVQKVLIISHMFPHPEQKLSGPFIHEQVKALREHEGIDARVISCRPYWVNGLNPFRIIRAFRHYPHLNQQVTWTEYKDVPVLYPYYRVGVPLIPFQFHAWLYSSAVMSVIDRVWKDFKFDIVHAHTGYLDGTAGLQVANRFQVPFVITEHTGPFTYLTGKPIVKQLTLHAIEKADRVWAVSDALANEIKSYYSNQDTIDRIKTLYNGVSTSEFYYEPIKQKKNKNIELLYVGFLEDVKNPLCLIEAFSKVKKVFPSISLKIVGDGSLFDQVKEKINQLGINDSCQMFGLKSRVEVARMMREECDIFVLPSKVETFGVVLIEAMSSGKPLVATKCGGPESIITEEFLGELCEKENADSLAEAILKVAKNIDKYDSERIREHAKNNFDYKVLAQKLCQQYQEIGTNEG